MRHLLLAAPLLCAACSVAAETPTQNTAPNSSHPMVIQTTYRCERSVSVPVTFVNTDDGMSLAIMQIDGLQVVMSRIMSGSGARYRAGNPHTPYEMHGKGKSATFSYGPEGDSSPVLSQCTG